MTTTSTATVAANLTPLTLDQLKPGLRVILLEGAETGATRGKVVQVAHGWADVRFEDGVTRKARAKVLARDVSEVVEFKVPPPAKAAPTLTSLPANVKPGSPAAKALAKKAAKVAPESKPAKSPKSRKPAEPGSGGPCLCACGGSVSKGRSFLQGHDARFHGWMRRLADQRLKPSEVPAAALRLMNLDRDGVPTTDYDGSPWKG